MTSMCSETVARDTVKTRVFAALQNAPATVRELEAAKCGPIRSIRRALSELTTAGAVSRHEGNVGEGARFALRREEAASGT